MFLKNDIHPSAKKKTFAKPVYTIVQEFNKFNIQIRELLLLKEALDYTSPQRENHVVIFP